MQSPSAPAAPAWSTPDAHAAAPGGPPPSHLGAPSTRPLTEHLGCREHAQYGKEADKSKWAPFGVHAGAPAREHASLLRCLRVGARRGVAV